MVFWASVKQLLLIDPRRKFLHVETKDYNVLRSSADSVDYITSSASLCIDW